MSKVVLLAVNAKYVHTSLAVRVIAAGINKYARVPHDVEIIEVPVQHISGRGDEIADTIAGHRPDVIGISTYIWNAGVLPDLIKSLRERLPDTIFVLGGPEVSYNAAYWLERGADYVLPGEGEYSFPPLLDVLSDAKTASGHSCKPAIPPPVRPDGPVDPYQCSGTGDVYGSAGSRDRILYVETSRGCPFKCSFCLSAGCAVRFFPIDVAKEWIRKLSRSGARTIKLVDRTFNCDAKRAYELFEYVIGLETSCCFHFEVAADLFDERTISLLSSATPGRIQLEAGLQSFYKPALEVSSRYMDMEKAARNIMALVIARNIHIHVDLIAGLPYETLIDFQDSFDRAYALGAHTLQLGFLKLLHGSQLRCKAEEFGIRYSEEPPYEIECSPWLSPEDIQILKYAENSLQHTVNKGRFLNALDYVLSASGLRPFFLFQMIGRAFPNHGTQLDSYAKHIYGLCSGIPGVSPDILCDRMTVDWLGMVKGKNMPGFMKNYNGRQRQAADAAKKQLGRGVNRCEAVVLRSGAGAFVDSGDRDPVTGLYRVYPTVPGTL